MQKAKEYGCKALCFEGNINFYGKSGFTYARDYGLRYHGLPDGTYSSFFLCKELEVGYFNGVTGEYTPPGLYMVDEQEAEGFDKTFEFKQKLVLPEQMF
ncbi:GNAT family acetyltransferase [uncultured Eubacterium sp.]|uniref:GNAT family acetyltransferase n=1 Tax=uncultured Eubacterium sp. TaxID=165185 RepID=UPI002804E8C8|nr:GNAT family acetyltransferase [uncultured Eubacterium sp.]